MAIAEEADNTNQREVEHFDRLAHRWWDPAGELRTLHHLNPLRTALITAWTCPQGKRVLDIGCGGGLLAEAMALTGAEVTGIDRSPGLIQVARLHQLASGVPPIRYLVTDAASLATAEPASQDIVCCLELLEHVPDPAALVADAARLVRPGGHLVFSTINRSLRSWLTAIVGAEYLAQLIPRGTHRFEQLIKPGELDRWARRAGLRLEHLRGIHYDPGSGLASETTDLGVNFIAHFTAPER
jgi:2-polyprenyl-6-hydroxyphenyl methylase / 3-demethylubiquinone-9 3-methyltransferase